MEPTTLIKTKNSHVILSLGVQQYTILQILILLYYGILDEKRGLEMYKNSQIHFFPWHRAEKTGSLVLFCLGGILKNGHVKLPRLSMEQCHC